MIKMKLIVFSCVAGAALSAAPSFDAAAQEVLGRNASECKIAASLGVAKAGCPKPTAGPRTRGLAIGNIDQMPSQPPKPAAQPAAAAATAAAPAAVQPKPTRPTPTAVPASPPAPAAGKVAFEINFEFGSSRLTPDARDILDRVGSVLNLPSAQSARFRIVGHTDSVGSSSKNQILSEQRAQSVRDYLVRSHGISARRLESLGMGESQPLNQYNTRAAENRRVEVINLGS